MALPAAVEVKLLKIVDVPEMVEVAVGLKVTVPLLWVNVPLLVKFFTMLKLELVGAEKVSLLPMVRLPLMLTGVLLALALINPLPAPLLVKLLLTVKVLVAKRYSGLPDAGEKSKL